MNRSPRRIVALGGSLLGLVLLLGCRSTPRPPPTRTSHRQELPASRGFPDREHAAASLPPSAQQAARDGIDWLRLHPQQLRESPYPVAVSAIALCAALRDPRLPQDEAIRTFCITQIEFLISRQSPQGLLSKARPTIAPYEHAWATRALCEAVGWAPHRPAWRQAAARAIAYIIDNQQPTGGWHYGYSTGRQRSTPLTVVQMDALFAAARNGMDSPALRTALQQAALDLQAIQDPHNGQFGYLMRGVGTPPMSGYALYGLQLAGHWESRSYRQGWLAHLESELPWPQRLQHPLFAAYYAHKSAFWQGGLPWQQWSGNFYAEILAGQQPDGHWPAPRAEAAFGRAYATALCSLMIRSTDDTFSTVEFPNPPIIPGPVYQIAGTTGTVYILPATFTERLDGLLLDPVLAAPIRAADFVWIEGHPRQWLHHWESLIQSPTGDSPRTAEQIQFLRSWFGVPSAVPHRIWNEIPAWALAVAVLGRSLEQAERQFEDTIESAVTRRMAPGKRVQQILPDTYYGNTLHTLPATAQERLLDHAIRISPEIASWIDQAADAWCRGDEAAMEYWHRQWLPTDRETAAALDTIFLGVRARYLAQILHSAQRPSTTWFIIPAWHWYGEQGLRQELQRQGYNTTLNPEF